MIVVAAVAVIVAVGLVAGVAWVIVQDAKASAVSDRWRDQHHRARRDE